MTDSVRLAGAALLCASLLLTGCAKKASTSTSTDATTTSADATPVAGAAAADATSAAATGGSTETTAPATTAATTTGATSSDGTKVAFIDIPVYPGASENKSEGMAMSANGTSVSMKVYSAHDDAKRVIEWYKSHLPSSWKNFEMTSDGKTTGTFSSEGGDGDQSLIISTQDDKTTRIQATTKHGK